MIQPRTLALGSWVPFWWENRGEKVEERERWNGSWAGETGWSGEMRVVRNWLKWMNSWTPESREMSVPGLWPRVRGLDLGPWNSWEGLYGCLWLLSLLGAVTGPAVWGVIWVHIGVWGSHCHRDHANWVAYTAIWDHGDNLAPGCCQRPYLGPWSCFGSDLCWCS